MPSDDAAERRSRAHASGLYPAPLNDGRSRNMQANRRTNTKPEMMLRSALHRSGYRYRKDLLLKLPDGTRARPDIVFTAARVAVFIDGCFWHACPQHGRVPGTNEWYWSPKLARNVDRDQRVTRALTEAGWHVVRIWEHEALDDAVGFVIAALPPRPSDPATRDGDSPSHAGAAR